MENEFLDYFEDLCTIIQSAIDHIFESGKIADLPLYLFAFGKNCILKYDVENEHIVDLAIRIVEYRTLTVDIEPFEYSIIAYVDNKKCVHKDLSMYVANTICECVEFFWNKRLNEEGIGTIGGAGRYITADLLK